MHDLVIRGGMVVDGPGSAPRLADVAVGGGVIRPTKDGATLLAAKQASRPPRPW